MRARHYDSLTPLSAVTGVAGVLFGIIVGYVIASGHAQSATPVAAAASAPVPTASASNVVTEPELQAFRDILANDPRNAKAAEGLGNKLYDAGRYAEAASAYQQAFANDPKNVNVSTDLGTAMYYAGRVEEALAQLDKSLAIDASHAQTLFNLGIIRRDGKKDAAGAVAAWQRLLAANPSYPEAARVRSLIAETK